MLLPRMETQHQPHPPFPVLTSSVDPTGSFPGLSFSIHHCITVPNIRWTPPARKLGGVATGILCLLCSPRHNPQSPGKHSNRSPTEASLTPAHMACGYHIPSHPALLPLLLQNQQAFSVNPPTEQVSKQKGNRNQGAKYPACYNFAGLPCYLGTLSL